MSKNRGPFGAFFDAWEKVWRTGKLFVLLVRAWVLNVAIGIDLLGNAVLGGHPGETISSRLGKGARAGKPVHTFFAKAVDVLFLLLFSDRDHCENSIQSDEGRNAISEVIDRYKRGDNRLWYLS